LYDEHLGQRSEEAWDFDIDELYFGCPAINGAMLTGPFSARDIEGDMQSMERASAPGPDGLGPSYYWAACDTVRPSLTRLFEASASRATDLQQINRAHVVLLPTGVLSSGSF
jgi:hypothetical protein